MLKSLKHTNWANTRGSNGPKEDSNSLVECFFFYEWYQTFGLPLEVT